METRRTIYVAWIKPATRTHYNHVVTKGTTLIRARLSLVSPHPSPRDVVEHGGRPIHPSRRKVRGANFHSIRPPPSSSSVSIPAERRCSSGPLVIIIEKEKHESKSRTEDDQAAGSHLNPPSPADGKGGRLKVQRIEKKKRKKKQEEKDKSRKNKRAGCILSRGGATRGENKGK